MNQNSIDAQLRELAVKQEEQDKVQDAYAAKRGKKSVLHPTHAKLVAASAKVAPPQHWPTFKLYESCTVGSQQYTVTCVTAKDFVLALDTPGEPEVKQGDIVRVNNHDFKVRKVKWAMITLRPVLGKSSQYI